MTTKTISRKGSSETVTAVMTDETSCIGFVRKFKNTRSSQSPFQAFVYDAAGEAKLVATCWLKTGLATCVAAIAANRESIRSV